MRAALLALFLIAGCKSNGSGEWWPLWRACQVYGGEPRTEQRCSGGGFMNPRSCHYESVCEFRWFPEAQ